MENSEQQQKVYYIRTISKLNIVLNNTAQLSGP